MMRLLKRQSDGMVFPYSPNLAKKRGFVEFNTPTKEERIQECNVSVRHPFEIVRCSYDSDLEKPVFCTFCTPDYREAAEKWRDSVEAFDLEAYIHDIPDAGTWRANTRQKPLAIKACREKFAGRAIVFCDADALLMRYPEIFDGCCLGDVGIYLLDDEFLSGTMYWGPGERASRLLEEWIKQIPFFVGNTCGEQLAFRKAFESQKNTLCVTYLPEHYCRIYDNSIQTKDPVILHLLHSRLHDVTKL